MVKALKDWTLNVIERHGFLAVFLLSAWPNAAFDMCGICCGQFMVRCAPNGTVLAPPPDLETNSRSR